MLLELLTEHMLLLLVIANYFPKDKYFGLLLSNEISSLKTALEKPKRPFTAIIGGAKITGKIDVITSLI